ncbi:MAG: hypothetical protein LUC88_04455 [Prevotella sp.]|nr:hypothetical protein [Prevotella sp.]
MDLEKNTIDNKINDNSTDMQQGQKKISKIGQRLESDNPPFWNLSELSPKEMHSLMRAVMK